MKNEAEAGTQGGERLQKLIARAGVASRRAAEELITQGRVSVNGHVITELGAKADAERDTIVVDGKPLRFRSGPSIVVLMHKPRGVVTTRSDPEGRPTVLDLLPRQYQHLHPVGRLDYDTAGVLLLTGDGELTQLLTHPSHGVEKVYWARVRGKVLPETLKRLEAGIYLDDGKTAPCRARVRAQTEQNCLVEVVLHEGRNRQVRRMLEAVGHPVSALRRVRFGNVELEGMASGSFRELLPGEVKKLRRLAEAEPQQKPRGPKPRPKKTRGATPKATQAKTPAPRTNAPATTKRPSATARPGGSARSERAERASAVPGRRPANRRSAPPSPSRPATARNTSPRDSAPGEQHPLAQRIEKQWKRTGRS